MKKDGCLERYAAIAEMNHQKSSVASGKDFGEGVPACFRQKTVKDRVSGEGSQRYPFAQPEMLDVFWPKLGVRIAADPFLSPLGALGCRRRPQVNPRRKIIDTAPRVSG